MMIKHGIQGLPNARFIVSVHGEPVKITLQPGEFLSWHKSGYDDCGQSEGEMIRWSYESGKPVVAREWWRGGFDGGLLYGGVAISKAGILQLREDNGRPAWTHIEDSRCD